MSNFLPEDFLPESQEGNSWLLIPDGEYVAEIVEAKVAQPKNGDGHFISLTWKLSDGDYEGRQIWQRVTFLHSNEQAQTIGRKTLKDVCVALGVNEHVKDVSVLLFKPARIRVGIEKDKTGQYEDKNRIKRVLPLDGAAPATAGNPPPKPGAPRPAGSAAWHQG
jgi:Protein of unknown function (DUF669)